MRRGYLPESPYLRSELPGEAQSTPGLVQAGGHPTLGLCAADVGAACAARASQSPAGSGGRGGPGDHGESLRFLRASSRNRRCGDAGRPGVGLQSPPTPHPAKDQSAQWSESSRSHSEGNLGSLGVEGSGKEGLGGGGDCPGGFRARGGARRRPCFFGRVGRLRSSKAPRPARRTGWRLLTS